MNHTKVEYNCKNSLFKLLKIGLRKFQLKFDVLLFALVQQ